MKAYVVRDNDGTVLRGWLVTKGPPKLSAMDRAWLARSKRHLEEVTAETAMDNIAPPCSYSQAAPGMIRRS